MKTNIEHLHEVIDGNLAGRRQGHTTSAFEVIAEVQLEQEFVICVCKNENEIVYFRNLLFKLFKEDDIRSIFCREYIIAEETRIEFVTAAKEELFLKSLDNYSLIHVK